MHRDGSRPGGEAADGVDFDFAVGETVLLERAGEVKVGGEEDVERRALLDLLL